MRAPGAGPDEFPAVPAALLRDSVADTSSGLLFTARERLGALLGRERPQHGLGARVRPLADRVPPEPAWCAWAGRPARTGTS